MTCDIGDQFIAEMYNYYIWNTLAIDAVTAICYAFVWVFIKKNVQGNFFVEAFIFAFIFIQQNKQINTKI